MDVNEKTKVNRDWNYKESLVPIVKIKKHYEDIMLSFSVFGGNNNVIKSIREIKDEIYSLKFEEWKRDKLWEYLNDDITYVDLWFFV